MTKEQFLQRAFARIKVNDNAESFASMSETFLRDVVKLRGDTSEWRWCAFLQRRNDEKCYAVVVQSSAGFTAILRGGFRTFAEKAALERYLSANLRVPCAVAWADKDFTLRGKFNFYGAYEFPAQRFLTESALLYRTREGSLRLVDGKLRVTIKGKYVAELPLLQAELSKSLQDKLAEETYKDVNPYVTHLWYTFARDMGEDSGTARFLVNQEIKGENYSVFSFQIFRQTFFVSLQNFTCSDTAFARFYFLVQYLIAERPLLHSAFAEWEPELTQVFASDEYAKEMVYDGILVEE